MSKSTISAIMPNYNDADYIGVSLKAVCEQSYPPSEVIVIDDASTDKSIQVIEEMMSKYPMIRLIRNDVNRGTNYSVNRAVALATSDLVCFPSANDQFLPGLFEKSVALLEKYPQAGLCCADMNCINVSNGSTYESYSNWLPEPGYLSPANLAEITRAGKIPHPHIYTTIIRREMLLSDCLFMPELEWYADWFLIQVIAFRHGCCYIPEPLALFRWLDHGNVYSGLQNRQYYKQIYTRIIQLLASPQYKDVCALVARGRSLQFIELYARTPLITWQALHDMKEQNNQAITLFLYITIEYLRGHFGIKALSTSYKKRITVPASRFVHEIKGLLKNLSDRTYARAFQKYDQTRSLIRKSLK